VKADEKETQKVSCGVDEKTPPVGAGGVHSETSLRLAKV
jgi:hypothetical protein